MIVPSSDSFLEKIALALFEFMQKAQLRVRFERDKKDMFSYVFQITDVTYLGVPFIIVFNLRMVDLKPEVVSDTPESIETFCFETTLKLAYTMLQERCTRQLEHVEINRLIVPKA